jgi:hypothetical protein
MVVPPPPKTADEGVPAEWHMAAAESMRSFLFQRRKDLL